MDNAAIHPSSTDVALALPVDSRLVSTPQIMTSTSKSAMDSDEVKQPEQPLQPQHPLITDPEPASPSSASSLSSLSPPQMRGAPSPAPTFLLSHSAASTCVWRQRRSRSHGRLSASTNGSNTSGSGGGGGGGHASSAGGSGSATPSPAHTPGTRLNGLHYHSLGHRSPSLAARPAPQALFVPLTLQAVPSEALSEQQSKWAASQGVLVAQMLADAGSAVFGGGAMHQALRAAAASSASATPNPAATAPSLPPALPASIAPTPRGSNAAFLSVPSSARPGDEHALNQQLLAQFTDAATAAPPNLPPGTSNSSMASTPRDRLHPTPALDHSQSHSSGSASPAVSESEIGAGNLIYPANGGPPLMRSLLRPSSRELPGTNVGGAAATASSTLNAAAAASAETVSHLYSALNKSEEDRRTLEARLAQLESQLKQAEEERAEPPTTQKMQPASEPEIARSSAAPAPPAPASDDAVAAESAALLAAQRAAAESFLRAELERARFAAHHQLEEELESLRDDRIARMHSEMDREASERSAAALLESKQLNALKAARLATLSEQIAEEGEAMRTQRRAEVEREVQMERERKMQQIAEMQPKEAAAAGAESEADLLARLSAASKARLVASDAAVRAELAAALQSTQSKLSAELISLRDSALSEIESLRSSARVTAAAEMESQKSEIKRAWFSEWGTAIQSWLREAKQRDLPIDMLIDELASHLAALALEQERRTLRRVDLRAQMKPRPKPSPLGPMAPFGPVSVANSKAGSPSRRGSLAQAVGAGAGAGVGSPAAAAAATASAASSSSPFRALPSMGGMLRSPANHTPQQRDHAAAHDLASPDSDLP